ncbi:hypothetical protein F0562_025140 [Nyssa sinensis]|uniref:DUF1639 domain-containing protein n=1 Tax=Nyssa sinensis TaxID=561372 RepID=A0A5J5BDU2_9ASTE|nr:hypothetical protein F0562_025140 [Nyssa sinensis]
MAMAPERSRPLHNFTLPRLKWGNQRFLRCMNVNANGEASADRRSSASEAESDGFNRNRDGNEVTKRRSSNGTESLKKSPLKPLGGDTVPTSNKDQDNSGIEAVREKLMYDLRLAADKMKVSILEEKDYEELNSARPWNLRTRRAGCKAPNESGGGGNGGKGANLRSEERHRNNCNSSPLRPEGPMAIAKSSRLRGLAAAATETQSVEKMENGPRAKFSISLRRGEVESDFLEMAGIRPPRRPKKRPKIVQKQLDSIFPGLWLTEITSDIYKVPDFPESGKGQG